MAQRLKTIETDRLILRGIDETDAELIVKWRSVPDVYQYFKSPHQITLEEHLDWYNNRYLANENRLDWICIEKEREIKIGVFGLHRDGNKAEVNYLLAPEGQHKGYAAETIPELINYAVINWNVNQVIAEIHMKNQTSIALMKRLGFKMISQKQLFVIYGIEV